LPPPFHARRLVGDANMQLIVAVWWHVHTAERPLAEVPGWHVVDRLDVADLEDERDHGWRGELGRRRFGDPTARWTVFHKENHPRLGLLLDGGRTIRGGGERFALDLDPARPARLVIRGGGRPDYAWNEPITRPVPIEVVADDTGELLARGELPAPRGALAEITLELARPARRLRVRAAAPYRVFHYFALQPE
jgi:hypothetical protein